MQTQGVDRIAWARRIAPLWLAWVMYAVPVAWLVLSVLTVFDDARLPIDGGSTVYDENGQIIESVSRPEVDLLTRIGVFLLMPYSSPMSADLALLGLGGAFAVSILWLGRPRPPQLRAVAAAGGLLCVPLVACAVLSGTTREQALKLWSVGWSSDSAWAVQHAPWAAVGLLGALLGWAFLRVGFGPLPVQAVEPVAAGPAQHVEAGPDAGSDPAAGGTVAGVVAARTAGVAAGVVAAGPDPLNGDRVAQGWDSRPELPPDFVAPPAGVSPFERPAPTAVGESRTGRSDLADEAEMLQSRDPMAVYRRPSGS